MDLQSLTIGELLRLHVLVSDELRSREVLRSSNNRTGDYAEYHFCRAFGWTQEPSSAKGFG